MSTPEWNEWFDCGNDVKPSETILLVDGTNMLYILSSSIEQSMASEHADFLTKMEQQLLCADTSINDDDIFENNADDEKYLIYKRNMFKAFFSRITNLYNKFKCHNIYLTFDHGKSWRVDYSLGQFENIKPITLKKYKGNRRKDLTAKQMLFYKMMKQVGKDIIKFMEQYTNIKCFYEAFLEADDLMSVIPRMEPNNSFIIVSSDSDLAQLQCHKNVSVYDTYNKKIREPIDINWFIFNKCIRGDKTDNVHSAFPRVRTKALEQAYKNPFDMVNIMEHTWTNSEGVVITVKDAYAENKTLMDLTQQPDSVKELMESVYNTVTQTNKQIVNKFTLGNGLSEMNLDNIKDELFANKLKWLFY